MYWLNPESVIITIPIFRQNHWFFFLIFSVSSQQTWGKGDAKAIGSARSCLDNYLSEMSCYGLHASGRSLPAGAWSWLCLGHSSKVHSFTQQGTACWVCRTHTFPIARGGYSPCRKSRGFAFSSLLRWREFQSTCPIFKATAYPGRIRFPSPFECMPPNQN